jgi:hypothetical protein
MYASRPARTKDRTTIARLKETLFREPRSDVKMGVRMQVAFALVGASVGALMVVRSLFFSDMPLSVDLLWAALGFVFVLQMGAELLPKRWKTAAGWLRVGALSVAVILLLVGLVSLFAP